MSMLQGTKRRCALLGACLCLALLFGSCGRRTDGASSSANGEEAGSIPPTASSENTGNVTADPMERLTGTFCIDGDETAASVVINPDRSFTAYYASGTPEQSGTVRYEANDAGFHVYVFYTDEGKPYMGFVDSGEPRISEFETGNGGYRYVRVR